MKTNIRTNNTKINILEVGRTCMRGVKIWILLYHIVLCTLLPTTYRWWITMIGWDSVSQWYAYYPTMPHTSLDNSSFVPQHTLGTHMYTVTTYIIQASLAKMLWFLFGYAIINLEICISKHIRQNIGNSYSFYHAMHIEMVKTLQVHTYI